MLDLIKLSVKGALWPLLPKPWEAEDMELHIGLWAGVSALFSDSGRQLGEENARPFLLNHHISAQTIISKYKGSREGREINMSALRIAMQNFDAALEITEAVRSYHLAQLPPSHVLGIWDLYIIARASIALVAYQQRAKHQHNVPRTVSDALTSQYQFISGVFMIGRHMLENGDPAIAQNNPASAETLYNYADENGIFISFNGMACAGSTKKIHEFLEFCNKGYGDEDRPEFDLSRIVHESGNWYQYALATIDLDCFIEYERVKSHSAQPPVDDIAKTASARSYADLGEYVSGLMEHSIPEQDMPFHKGALLRQNVVLDWIGRKPIKKIQEKHLLARLA